MLLRSPNRRRCGWLSLLALAPALAAAQPPPTSPRWTGIDLSTVEDLSPPRADGFTSGFTADFRGGLVRVYVLPSASAASWWVARMVTVVEKQKPKVVVLPGTEPASGSQAPNPSALETAADASLRLTAAHELYTSGDRLVIARFDNVGLMVEVRSGAQDRAEALLEALSDEPLSWPEVPPLERTSGGWTLHAAANTELRFEGGALTPDTIGLQFIRPPSRVVVYDVRGRAVRQSFDEVGLPIETPQPWAEHTLTERAHAAPESP